MFSQGDILAKEYFKNGEYEKALLEYKKLYARSPSNITYIYGATDQQIGSLTAEEVAFLKSKNANILSGSGGHDVPFEGYIEQGFREAFGIELLP